jgi:hypothetical protein
VLDRQQRALAESVRCGCALDIDLEPLPSDHQRPPPCAAFFYAGTTPPYYPAAQ